MVNELTFQNYSLFKKLKKFKENKKGSLAIEIVIGMLAFILVLSFLMDLLMLSWKFAVLSQTSNYVVRTAGIQGGYLTSAPSGFQGGNAEYVSSSEISKDIEDKFAYAGIKKGEYTVRVNGYNITNGGGTTEIDYRKPITTHIEVQYRWAFIDNFIPGQLTQTISSKRSAVSEFKYRYDTWVGE